MKKVAVMGHGVVGSGVCEVMMQNAASIAKRCGENLEIKYILDLRDFEGLPYSDKFTKDVNVIINDPEVEIVAEVMGGVEPAFTFVKACLEKNKSVVTSNKALVAAKGVELLQIARDHNVNFLFEASVGGGIPIIHPLYTSLAANNVTAISGILNGTTNFILTKMIRENDSFENALKTAQELGYAERDPSADVEGLDACRKICILASLAFGKAFIPEDVHTEGITGITKEDVQNADQLGYVIKLIGQAKKIGDRVSLIVAPMLISKYHQLASIEGVFNAVAVTGDEVGDVVFSGQGAGKLATASAVVADIIEAAKASGNNVAVFWEDADPTMPVPFSERVSAFMVKAEKALPANLVIRSLSNGVVITKPLTEKEMDDLQAQCSVTSKIRLFNAEVDA